MLIELTKRFDFSKRQVTFWRPTIDPSQPKRAPNAISALQNLNPAPDALRALGLPEVENPFLIRFKGEDPTRPIEPLHDVVGWEWDESPNEFRERERAQATDVFLTTRKAGDFGLVGLVAERGGYEHLGIALGDGTVVHFTSGPGRKRLSAVERTGVLTSSRSQPSAQLIPISIGA